MTSAADNHPDLVAYLYGELDPVEHRRVEAALAESPELRAELDGLRSTLELVRSAPVLEDDAGFRERLSDELEAALTGSTPAPVHDLAAHRASGGLLSRAWGFAVYRYETSAAVRRAVGLSVFAHAAAAAFVAWMLVVEVRREPVRIDVAGIDERPTLQDELDESDPLLSATDRVVDAEPPPSEADAWPEQFVDSAPDGVPAWPRPRQTAAGQPGQLRFPTLPYMIRMRAVFDLEARANKLERHAGELADWVPQGISQGLDWLADQQSVDGTWSPSEDAPDAVRTGVTAAVVLAFTSDGRSAVAGVEGAEQSASLAPAVAHLLREVADEERDELPLMTYALAVQALTRQYGIDYRHLSGEERIERERLLRDAGAALVARQRDDGGFPADPTHAHSDAPSTLLASTALIELRVAGALDTKDVLRRAGGFLDGRRDAATGLLAVADGAVGEETLSAALLSISDELELVGPTDSVLDAVAAAIDAPDADPLLGWAATAALKRHDRPLTTALARLRSAQSDDGRWSATGDLAEGGDALSTAVGVLSLTRLFLAN